MIKPGWLVIDTSMSTSTPLGRNSKHGVVMAVDGIGITVRWDSISFPLTHSHNRFYTQGQRHARFLAIEPTPLEVAVYEI